MLDDADYRATALVRTDYSVREPGFPCDFVVIGETRVSGWMSRDEAVRMASELCATLSCAIRDAVAAAETVAGYALRDMAIDSEAYHRGWSDGVNTICASIDEIINSRPDKNFPSVPIPAAPSHDRDGEPLPLPRAHRENNALRACLEKIEAILEEKYSMTHSDRRILSMIRRVLKECQS